MRALNRLNKPSPACAPLQLLSVVIPARDEEGCIGNTVEHLDLELRLQNIPHEIVVVDDGSTDGTWSILTTLQVTNQSFKMANTSGTASEYRKRRAAVIRRPERVCRRYSVLRSPPSGSKSVMLCAGNRTRGMTAV